MGSRPEGPYGLIPPGQPAALAEGEFVGVAPRLPLFGMGYAGWAGRPRAIVIPNPAAGAEWKYTHAGRSFLVIRSIIWTLTASAVVANRYSRLQLMMQGILVGQFPPDAAVAASSVKTYNANDSGAAQGDPGTSNVGLPADLIVADNMSIGSNTENLDVADQYSAIAIYAEEFTDRGLNL